MAEEKDTTEYIRELRAEAKEWRLKAQDLKSELEKVDQLESEIKSTRVENELIRRGVQAEPTWVPINEGQSTAEAVDAFLEKYPHLKTSSAQENSEEQAVEEPANKQPERKAPDPLPRDTNNSSGSVSSGHLKGRTVEEIRTDPKARRNAADLYQSLLYKSVPEGE